ncbi:leucine-rich repeat-containing protein kinase family protein [Methylobacterium durans]|uniref:Protein kinase n=1 Tax=Methylobacterium durans TaxID=2202825 RepID=A0A2U8WD05_9HYPH|nr:leucine-rich repeat-containing protein kinase family protein [Methylobacterium durans]AWN43320.1 protein kinase [Methylobacterium durans]
MQAKTSHALQALRRGDLSGTRELRLTGGLTEVPPEIFGLAETLEVLDLSGNALTALPAGLSRLRRLRVLFCSGNRFERLPPVLGDCPALSQIGFRGTGMREVPGEALPPALRWLTLTDNRIADLPDAIGARPHLQKLMLAGNRLRSLPSSLAQAARLELVRLSANGIAALPAWIAALPRLAWLSWAGNPCEPAIAPAAAPAVPWTDILPGEILGEGASGRVHRALLRDGSPEPARPVALKLFKGAMTSDGLPEREMAACLAAGAHPNLAGAIGRLAGHPEGAQGLLMPLLPARWRPLAGPPSLASCSRDVYDPDLRLDASIAHALATAVGRAAAHLHGRGLLHGDLYAHNILWDGSAGEAVLTDFGAASALPEGPVAPALERVEVRAFGLLLGELLARCPPDGGGVAAMRALEAACVSEDAGTRPRMTEVLAALAALRPR